MENICKICGGSIVRDGNFYICEYCGNKWEIDSGNDIHAVDRANAWRALRDSDFEKAAELFEHIIAKESDNYEAYWGRALAQSCITYVTDLSENKKVPTCNNITDTSFLNGRDVQKAISLAPSDIGENYRKQASYIDKVRVEWLEKASREPAYDVFISYKDSDRENGIVRTQDSIDAQDLYNALAAEGYKVFFSRVSLRDKISEQYEPYIYNAIKTSKVMIVFGEKPEYFNAVWVKNEWTRFKTCIQKGEKHKNSLVVVYKNMDPSALPVVLSARQCLNAADMTFLSDLTRHIKRVVAESQKNVHLEKIAISGGQIAQKATTLSVNAVQTRQIGAGAIAETSITEKQTINLIYSYLRERQWQGAADLTEEVLFNNPGCAEALWCKLLASMRVSDGPALVGRLDAFVQNDYVLIEKILNCASAEFAEQILPGFYQCKQGVSDLAYKKMLQTILPYSFAQRQSYIQKAFANTVAWGMYSTFLLLLTTLESHEVDLYIAYNRDYVNHAKTKIEKLECFDRILSVDRGNVEVLRDKALLKLKSGEAIETLTEDFEELLKYTNNVDREVETFLDWLVKNAQGEKHCTFAKQLLRYYTKEIVGLKKTLVDLSYRILEQGYFKGAEFFLSLILSVDPQNVDAYWGICLMKTGAKNDKQIVETEILLMDLPEFNKYLTLVPERRRRECISLSTEQIRKKKETLAAQCAEEKKFLDGIAAHKAFRKKAFLAALVYIACVLYIFLNESFWFGSLLPAAVLFVVAGLILSSDIFKGLLEGAWFENLFTIFLSALFLPLLILIGPFVILFELCVPGKDREEKTPEKIAARREKLEQLEDELKKIKKYTDES